MMCTSRSITMTKVSMPTTSTRLTFTLSDFSGGLVNNVNDVKMKDSESPDMLNMQFRNDGLIQKRPGCIHLHSCSEGTEIYDFIPFEVAPNEYLYIYRTPYQMYFDSQIVEYDEETETETYRDTKVVIWESPLVGAPAPHTDLPSVEINWVQYMGSLIFSDGTNLYRFGFDDEGKPRTHKIVNPPSDFTPIAKPALTGATKEKLISTYKYLHWNFVEGFDYRDETYTLQDEYGHAYYVGTYEYTDLVDGVETTVTEEVNIYKYDYMKYDENMVGASLYEIWYEPCQYELEDGYKGTNLLPPSVGVMEVHKDRLYISGSQYDRNMVWISDILNPYYFPSALPISTPPNGDYITALHSYNDALIIGRRDSIFALFGNTDREDNTSAYTLVELNVHTGMANGYSANNVYHMMFFVGSDGNFYKLLPPSTVSSSFYTAQLNTKIDITLPPFNLSRYSVLLSTSAFDSSEGLWYVQVGEHTLVYNYALMAWTRYNNINAIKFAKIDNEVYYLNTFGSVYKLPNKNTVGDYFDDVYESAINEVIKIPINAYWTSRNMDMGVPSRVKQFRDTYVTSECFEDYPTTVKVKYEVDYAEISGEFKVENEIAKWDKAIFGKSKFTSRNIDRSLPIMLNRRGRTIKVFYGSGYNYVGVWDSIPEPGSVNEGDLFYSMEDKSLFIRVSSRREYATLRERYYMNIEEVPSNDALLVHNVMGVYELKGYR